MAFMTHSLDDNRVDGIEYLPASAFTPKVGMALTQSGGQLAMATGTTKPTYISRCERESACTAGELIPVVRVDSDQIYETAFAAAATGIKLGNKVTLHTDGMQVTATTASGVAEVVYMDGTASGSMCRVRF